MTDLAVLPQAKSEDMALDVRRVVSQTKAIQECMQAVMIKDVHYGVIDGTDKPTLYQPGADKLCLLFRLRPRYVIRREERPDFIAIETRCRLIHIPTGEIWGEGMGSANSREDKYLNQSTAKNCPNCKKSGTIFRSKFGDGKGWYCNQKKGGCNAAFQGGDPAIEGQGIQIVGDKVWNLHNTILKISCKRSKTAGILTVTAASDIFAQDLEDLDDVTTGLDEQAAGVHSGETKTKPKTNGSGEQPKSNGNGASNGATTNGAGKRATPTQVAALNVALKEMNIPSERRMEWVNEMLGREFPNMMELHPEDADMLIGRAKAGEVPGRRI